MALGHDHPKPRGPLPSPVLDGSAVRGGLGCCGAVWGRCKSEASERGERAGERLRGAHSGTCPALLEERVGVILVCLAVVVCVVGGRSDCRGPCPCTPPSRRTHPNGGCVGKPPGSRHTQQQPPGSGRDCRPSPRHRAPGLEAAWPAPLRAATNGTEHANTIPLPFVVTRRAAGWRRRSSSSSRRVAGSSLDRAGIQEQRSPSPPSCRESPSGAG